MAICRMCHKSIPDGMDFCEECAIKRNNQADESYLDSLLSSVSGNSANSAVRSLRRTNTTEQKKQEAPQKTAESGNSLDDLLGGLGDSAFTPEEDVSLDSLLAGLDDTQGGSDITEETVSDIPDEPIADLAEETIADIPDEPIADIPEDMTADIAGDITADIPEEAIADIPMGIQDEPISDMVMDISDEPVADIPMDIPEEPVADMLMDISDEPVADIPMDTPEEPLADIPTDMPEDVLDAEIPLDMGISDDMISDIPEDVTADITGDIPMDIPGEAISDIPMDIPGEAISDIPMDIPGEAISDIPMDIPEEAISDIPMDIPEETISDIPMDIMDEPVADIPMDIPDEPIADIPEDTGGLDELMSDIPAGDEDAPHEADTGEDMDELLSSLLADMDNAKAEAEPEDENPIKADDIEGLFDTAESMIEPENNDSLDIDGILDESGLDLNPSDEETDILADAGADADILDVGEGPDISVDEIDPGVPEGGFDMDIPLGDPDGAMPDFGSESSGSSDAKAADDGGISQADLEALGAGLDIEIPGQDTGSIEAIDGIDIGGASDISMIDPITGEALDQANIDMLFTDVSEDEGGNDGFLSEEDLENATFGEEGIGSFLEEIDTGEFEERIKNLDDGSSDKKGGKKKKKSLFERLFANIKEDLTPEQIKEREEKAKAEEEAKKKAEEDKKKQAELSKEQKEAAKAEAKAKAEEEAKKKAEEKKRKAEEAKEKAKKKKEERLAIEEFEADEGRINRAGATLLFVIFAILTIFIIVGTNIYSYNLSIQTAEEEFGEKHYNEAYYQVYGLKVQDKDIELVDKIMTAMYVQNALNSYNNYMYSHNDEKALDALLKGLQRYDKYLELAKLLGITEDLNYLKSQILVALDRDFDISEKKAYDMIAIRDDLDYSEYIYSLLGTYDLEIFE